MRTFINDAIEILDLLYKHGWDERNGGNLSCIISKEEKDAITKNEVPIRIQEYDFDMTPIIGYYFVITGTGKYFRNCIADPEGNLAVVKILNKNQIGILWGLTDGTRTTSETPTHLQCHIERLKVDPDHRIVMHCHPDNVIAMTHVHSLDSNRFTETLWKMQTESIVVFPEGVGVLPWMVCGGRLIGDATANLMKEYRSVVWGQHGLFCTGRNLDETCGLVETIEKAASIFMLCHGMPIKQSITNENLRELAKEFKINYRKGVID